MCVKENTALVFRIEQGRCGEGIHLMTACMLQQQKHVMFVLEEENSIRNVRSIVDITPCDDSCLGQVGRVYDLDKKTGIPFKTKEILQALEQEREREALAGSIQLTFNFPNERHAHSLIA